MDAKQAVEGEIVDAKELFEQVREGDKLHFGDRSEPVTVYRHVDADDRDGQIITMAEVDEEWEMSLTYDRENGNHPKAAKAVAGDLVEGELTGKEFLVVRGPRGGAYVLTQKWSKRGGYWSAQINLFRRTRKPYRVWGWECYADDLKIVGHEDVDRDEFDAGSGPWVRHTTVWAPDRPRSMTRPARAKRSSSPRTCWRALRRAMSCS